MECVHTLNLTDLPQLRLASYASVDCCLMSDTPSPTHPPSPQGGEVGCPVCHGPPPPLDSSCIDFKCSVTAKEFSVVCGFCLFFVSDFDFELCFTSILPKPQEALLLWTTPHHSQILIFNHGNVYVVFRFVNDNMRSTPFCRIFIFA